MKKLKYKAVLVEWVDSANIKFGWVREQDTLNSLKCTICVSIAHLISEDDMYITITPTIGYHDTEGKQFNGLMVIPKKCINNITHL